jgi:hypothetical protein
VGTISNERGQLCSSYPLEILVLENERSPPTRSAAVNDAHELPRAASTYGTNLSRIAVPEEASSPPEDQNASAFAMGGAAIVSGGGTRFLSNLTAALSLDPTAIEGSSSFVEKSSTTTFGSAGERGDDETVPGFSGSNLHANGDAHRAASAAGDSVDDIASSRKMRSKREVQPDLLSGESAEDNLDSCQSAAVTPSSTMASILAAENESPLSAGLLHTGTACSATSSEPVGPRGNRERAESFFSIPGPDDTSSVDMDFLDDPGGVERASADARALGEVSDQGAGGSPVRGSQDRRQLPSREPAPSAKLKLSLQPSQASSSGDDDSDEDSPVKGV